jgi:uncharacterized MnhB-related membrane protein
MLRFGFSTLQQFVLLMGISATLVAFWMTFVILHRRLLERAAVILAAISGALTAYLYVAMWGVKLLPV